MQVKSKRMLLSFAVSAFAVVAVSGCKYHAPELFTESQILGGKEVSADTLNHGQEQYILYCYACHGTEGDGRGPASKGLRPPPRDFRLSTYKFARSVDGLPHDEDLKALIKRGLDGTAMLSWDVPKSVLNDIVQFIKTFAPEDEGWRDEDAELGERVVAGKDPWQGKEAEAIERGNQLYHGYQCYSCHAAYVTEQGIYDAALAVKNTAVTSFRDNLFRTEPKPSSIYTVPIRTRPCDTEEDCGEGGTCLAWQCNPTCEESEDCGDGQVCRYGICERKLRIKPPDFTMDPIRMGSGVEDLYRTIAAGIPGSGMPQWKGSVPDEDIWAVARYVNHLAALRDTPAALVMKARLLSAPKFKAPKFKAPKFKAPPAAAAPPPAAAEATPVGT